MLIDEKLAEDAMRYGVELLRSNFQEVDGFSTVRVVQYNGWVWYILMKNGRHLGMQVIGKAE